MKKKLLIPLLTLKENGGNLLIFDLAKSLSSAGIEIVIISTNIYPCSQKDEINAAANIILTPNIFSSRILTLLFYFLYCNLWSLLNRPHVLYNFFPTQFIYSHPHSRRVCIVQDLEYRFYRKFSKVAKQLCLKIWKTCYVITTSSYLESCLRRLKIVPAFGQDIGISDQILSLANSSISSIPERHYDFLLIAKKGFHKRGEETTSLAQDLAKVGYRVLLIDQIGFQPCRPLPSSLSVLPAQPHASLTQLLMDSKVYVSLSRAEGYGLPPLEALALGCYVIATKSPSLYGLTHPHLFLLSGYSLDLLDISHTIFTQIPIISQMPASLKESLRLIPSRSRFTHYASSAILAILSEQS